MIRALRVRHRATFLVLAALLPAGLAVALGSRRSVPPSPAPVETPEIAVSGPPLSTALVGGVGIAVLARFWDRTESSAAVLELRAERDLGAPDVLLYWAPAPAPRTGETGATGSLGSLPEGSVLLGPFVGTSSRRFHLPEGQDRGLVALYSLGHQRVIWSWEIAP